MSSSEVLPSSGSQPGTQAGRRPRRWLRRLLWSVLAVVVALALVFFAGGGWYFAGQIRSGALAVEPGAALPAYNTARVAGVSPGQIQLRAIGDQPAVSKPALYGIAWRGGIGHLGTSAAVPALVIHGTDELTVPIATSIRLKQLKPALVTLVRFPGAGHTESWNVDRARYTSVVDSFLAPVAP